MSPSAVVTCAGAHTLSWLALGGLVAGCGGTEHRATTVSVVDDPALPVAPATAPAPPAPSAAALPDLADPSWNRVPSRAGTYEVLWRPSTGAVPRNQDFALDVWVLRGGTVAADVTLEVRAWMPDHGHGMLRRPSAQRRADGSFHVEGMLLHMRGHWQLFFELLEGSLAETAECALDL